MTKQIMDSSASGYVMHFAESTIRYHCHIWVNQIHETYRNLYANFAKKSSPLSNPTTETTRAKNTPNYKESKEALFCS